jgi:hypothetical protein
MGSGQVIAIGASPEGERFSTRRIWELERRALATVSSKGDRAVVPDAVISRTLAARPTMKPDQEAMVTRLLGGGEGLVAPATS